MTQPRNRVGFTLIELMLSMSFIGILLIGVAVTTIEITRIYTKGLTVREVNQAGRNLSKDIERTISTSVPFLSSNEGDSMFVNRPEGGRLCTGSYTYAWNYGTSRELNEKSTGPPAYNKYAGGGEAVRFAKISDAGGALCTSPATQIPKSNTVELLQPGDRNLAIQSFNIEETSRDDVTGQALYNVSFVIATNDQTQLEAGGSKCRPPTEGEGNADFCAINQFEMVIRAGNISGGL